MRDLTNQPDADTLYRLSIDGRFLQIDGLELAASFESVHSENRDPTISECADAVRALAKWEDDGSSPDHTVRDTALFKVVLMVMADMEKVGNVLGLPSNASPPMERQHPTSASPSPRLQSG